MALLTGTSGLLGVHLAYTLLKNGEEVFALRRTDSDINIVLKIFGLYEKKPEYLFHKIRWIEGDIQDSFRMREIIKEHREVYHTAAFVSFHKKDHSKIMDTNVQGTINIIEACKEHKARLVYTSSIAALGRGLGDTPTSEEDYRDRNYSSSVYSKSKFLAEQEVWRAIAEGLKAVIINPSVILGPGNWSKSSAQLFKTVKNGLKFYTNGSNGYVDVRDVAEIMYRLMKSEIHGERFVVSAENLNYKDLFSEIAHAFSVRPPQILAGKFLSEVSWRLASLYSFFTGKTPLITKETAKSANTYYHYSSEKIINALDYKFISIKESINHAVNAYLNETKP